MQLQTHPLTLFTFSPSSSSPPPHHPSSPSSSPARAPAPAAPALGTTKIPTNIHLDLLLVDRARGDFKIPDPHLGIGEKDVQWVHGRDWVYKCSFPTPAPYTLIGGRERKEGGAGRVCLVFKGLDTFCTVFLNGVEVLKCRNMFLEYRVVVDGLLRDAGEDGGKNELALVFESALRVGDEVMRKSGGERVCWNGFPSRAFVRKAQYHYGWDWGPCLITCGPWKPIYIEQYTARFSSVHIFPIISADLKKATLRLEAAIESTLGEETYCVSVVVNSPGGVEYRLLLEPTGDLDGVEGGYKNVLELDDPELWFPVRCGAQNLYTVSFMLETSASGSEDMQLLHTVTKKTGLRRVKLIQNPLPVLKDKPVSGGKTFYFEINNVPIFSAGSNWIPGDSFLPRFTREKLWRWLKNLLVDRGNQNMIRVWGGGIYESEEFYDACDELGILVWQDVCLACADYPAHLDWFVESLSKEVEQNLERLRWHPSLVIVAGNNEDYQVADEELGYDHDAPSETWRGSKFPGRWLYEKVFPEIVKRVCNGGLGKEIGDAGGEGAGGVVYWPGSPWGGEDSTDRTVGDIHQWNIWGGVQAPYQRYPDLGGRFISEFGMISFPVLQTIKEGYLSPSHNFEESVKNGDFHPQSEIVEHHIKAGSFEKRMMAYLGENFRILGATSTNASDAFKETVYISQLLQSEALGFAYKGWRKRWEGRQCGGALVWQLNDVWPVTSWSIVDHYLRPKPAFYTISRALRPITLILTRHTNNPKPNSKVEALVNSKTAKGAAKASLHSTPHIYPPKKSTIELHVSSILPEAKGELKWEVREYSVNTGEYTTVAGNKLDSLYPHGTQKLYAGNVPEEEPTTVHALLWDAEGTLLARETDWPQPFKHYKFPDPGLDVRRSGKDRDVIVVNVQKPVKALVFDEIDGVEFGDNCLDVMPGDEQRFAAKGLESKELSLRYYGMAK